MMVPPNQVIGKVNEEGNVEVFFDNFDGTVERATRLLVDGVYPVGSYLSTRHEHPAGITLTPADAEKSGVSIVS